MSACVHSIRVTRVCVCLNHTLTMHECLSLSVARNRCGPTNRFETPILRQMEGRFGVSRKQWEDKRNGRMWYKCVRVCVCVRVDAIRLAWWHVTKVKVDRVSILF